MIQSLQLHSFKGFQQFTVTFPDNAVLVGPNNAGKSTIIAALRAAASMVRTAGRLRPQATYDIRGTERFGFNFIGDAVGLIEENLHHEMHETETRLTLKFKGDSSVEALWAPGEDGGFFYAMDNDINPRQPKHVRSALPNIGLVPVLAPTDHRETLLSDSHVRSNLDSRLASRHFRNQLHLLSSETTASGTNRYNDFKAFAQPWISELELTDLRIQYGGDSATLDLFYLEPGSRNEREIFWAGDGMQIWMQLLLHLYRLKGMDVVVLDEPDVFLHSDLQRRLSRLLEELPCQTIMATHSPEVVSDAARGSIIWISRERRRAVREPKGDLLLDLSTALGTQFNLSLARALKTKTVLFVEGNDLKVLSQFARAFGFRRLHRERGIAVIPLGGFDGWQHVEPFKWLMDEFFKDAASVHVILDRDYRIDETLDPVRRRLRKAGISPHIWRRKEIENYLISPSAIARVSGASEAWVEQALLECVAELEGDVYAQIHAEYVRAFRKTGRSDATISKEAKERADGIWRDPQRRLHACGGKDLIRLINARLQKGGHSSMTIMGLAKALRPSEIPDEMKSVLETIESDVGQ